MERLTDRDVRGTIRDKVEIQDVINKLYDFENLEDIIGISLKNIVEIFSNNIPCECQNPQKTIVLTDEDVDRWNEYKNANKQDLLLRLPCKVGTKVWTIMCGINGMHPTIFMRDFELSMVEYFGISVFLTREEAEQKLKEMEGSHDGE